jgi:hypothetical protein
MNAKSDKLRIELIDSEEALLAIQDAWDELHEKSINPSFYSTFLFVSTAWKYFRSETDRLCVLVVKRDSTLVGIAPFRIGNVRVGNIRLLRGMQLRVIQFIAEWGSGDKPVIVTTEKPELVWDRIFQYLSKEFTQWDGIWLVEQPADSHVLSLNISRHIWCSVRVVPNVPSFYLLFDGTWEEYIKTRGKNTHRIWKKSRKKLFDIPEGVVFQYKDDPESIPDSLKRFITLEQYGWKKNRNFSVGSSERNKGFYEELLVQSAHKKMATIYFLTAGSTDIAGIIVYKCYTTVYGAQVTYNPMYAKYSPGVILNAEIIKMLFGTYFREYDFLGFQEGDEKNSSKKKWSTGMRQTVTIMVNKKTFPMMLYLNGNRLKTSIRNVIKMLTGNTISEKP